MGQRSFGRRTGLIGLLLLVALIILLITRIDIDGMLQFPDRLAALPTIAVRYREVVSKISDATAGDKLLKASDYPLTLLRSDLYRGCIRGGMDRLYGTHQSYPEVLANFRKAFPESAWKWNTMGDHFTVETAYVSVAAVDPSWPAYDINKDNYRTVYSVLLSYADPAVWRCEG